jgi:hypothetical protein
MRIILNYGMRVKIIGLCALYNSGHHKEKYIDPNSGMLADLGI